jgi:hypothetical protein
MRGAKPVLADVDPYGQHLKPGDPNSSKPRHDGLSELRCANPTIHKSMNSQGEDRLDQKDRPSNSNPERI